MTQFDRFGDEDDFKTLADLKQELRSRFPNYVGTVQYRSNVDEWRQTLELLVDKVVFGNEGEK